MNAGARPRQSPLKAVRQLGSPENGSPPVAASAGPVGQGSRRGSPLVRRNGEQTGCVFGRGVSTSSARGRAALPARSRTGLTSLAAARDAAKEAVRSRSPDEAKSGQPRLRSLSAARAAARGFPETSAVQGQVSGPVRTLSTSASVGRLCASLGRLSASTDYDAGTEKERGQPDLAALMTELARREALIGHLSDRVNVLEEEVCVLRDLNAQLSAELLKPAASTLTVPRAFRMASKSPARELDLSSTAGHGSLSVTSTRPRFASVEGSLDSEDIPTRPSSPVPQQDSAAELRSFGSARRVQCYALSPTVKLRNCSPTPASQSVPVEVVARTASTDSGRQRTSMAGFGLKISSPTAVPPPVKLRCSSEAMLVRDSCDAGLQRSPGPPGFRAPSRSLSPQSTELDSARLSQSTISRSDSARSIRAGRDSTVEREAAGMDPSIHMACCLVAAADCELRCSAGESGHPSSALAQARLDLALDMLASAVDAGLQNFSALQADPRLQVLRELRPERFGALAKRLKSQADAAVPHWCATPTAELCGQPCTVTGHIQTLRSC